MNEWLNRDVNVSFDERKGSNPGERILDNPLAVSNLSLEPPIEHSNTGRGSDLA